MENSGEQFLQRVSEAREGDLGSDDEEVTVGFWKSSRGKVEDCLGRSLGQRPFPEITSLLVA